MPFVGGVYTAWSGYGLRGFLLRGVVAAACLLPPTLLMGATLPALARRVEAPAGFLAWLPLRREHRRGGVRMPARRFLFAARVRRGYGDVRCRGDQRGGCRDRSLRWRFRFRDRTAQERRPRTRRSALLRTSVYLAIALSGLCALAAEAIWTRMLGLLLGASVYTLSIILAVFLTGLGIGSGMRAHCSAASSRARGWRWAGASCSLPARSPGPRTAWPHRSPTGPSIRPSPRTSGSTFSSTSTARFGLCCRRRFCGARASRWRLRRPRSKRA